MDEKTLLDMAKGIVEMPELSKHDYWMLVPEKKRDYEQKRKLARRAIHRIVKNQGLGKEITDEDQLALMGIIEPQLDANLGLSWRTFAFSWDLNPKNHTKIVLKEKWMAEGGGFDTEFGLHKPNAFTKQEL